MRWLSSCLYSPPPTEIPCALRRSFLRPLRHPSVSRGLSCLAQRSTRKERTIALPRRVREGYRYVRARASASLAEQVWALLDEKTAHADAESAGTTTRAPSPRSLLPGSGRDVRRCPFILNSGEHGDSTVLWYVVFDSYRERCVSSVPSTTPWGTQGFGAPSRHSGRVKTKSHLLSMRETPFYPLDCGRPASTAVARHVLSLFDDQNSTEVVVVVSNLQ